MVHYRHLSLNTAFINPWIIKLKIPLKRGCDLIKTRKPQSISLQRTLLLTPAIPDTFTALELHCCLLLNSVIVFNIQGMVSLVGVGEQLEQEQGTRLLELLEIFHLTRSFLARKHLHKLAYHYHCRLHYTSSSWFRRLMIKACHLKLLSSLGVIRLWVRKTKGNVLILKLIMCQ